MRKYLSAIIILIVLAGALAINLGTWFHPDYPIQSLTVRIIISAAFAVVCTALIIAFIQRVREIKKEKNDDLSQY